MEPAKPIRLLIVDDSAFVRMALARRLAPTGIIEVAGTAANGQEAVQQVLALRPDVVTLDVNMPVMDGLTALQHIMRQRPTPVVMLSSHTDAGTASTIRALELGAVDFFLKPSMAAPSGSDQETLRLCDKIVSAARIPRALLRPAAFLPQRLPPALAPAPPARAMQCVILIACSTGGPKALLELAPQLPSDLPASLIIVQHMPQGFTQSLAERLDATSAFRIAEAQEGDEPAAGRGYVAPGGRHLVVRRTGRLHLNQGPPVLGLCPAADVTMESAAAVYGNKVIGLVLTGMGSDGTRGARAIRAAGGVVVAEHESSCVVYGMPRSVIEAGLANRVAPLPGLIKTIMEMCLAGTPGR